MSITIKMDIRTRKDKTDLKSPYGYWGDKSAMEQLTIEEVMDRMCERNYMGMHEVLTGEKYRPYADLDFTEGITRANFEQKKYEILKKGHDMMERLFPDAQEINIFCSSGKTPVGKWKVSCHYIATGIYYTDKLHIKHILQQELGDPKTWKEQGWDEGVYNKDHLMRLPYCTKPGDKRVLRFAECFSVGDVQRMKYGEVNEDGEEDEYKADEGMICSGLITCVDSDEKEMPAPDGYVAPVKKEYVAVDVDLNDAQKTARYEDMKRLIAALAPHRANNRGTWTQGLWAIRRCAEKVKQVGTYRALAQEFSKKTDGGNYSEASTDDIYMEPVKEIGVGYKRLKEWADEDTPGWDKVNDFTIAVEKDAEFDIELIKGTAKLVKQQEHVQKFKDAVVDYMNHFYTLIKWGKKPFIISLTYQVNNDGIRVPELDYKSEKALELDFKNKTMPLWTGEKKPINFNPYNCWLEHPKRSEKARVYFNPKEMAGKQFADPKAFNLYTGPGISHDDCKDAEPLKEDSPWLQHIFKRWCSSNKALYESVLNRFALQIQKPWIKQGVGIGLMSPEGAGKGIVLQPIFDIVGKKYVFIPSSPDQVLGKFNSGCEGKLMIFLDELTWGGDKEREGALKRLVTESQISIERKGIDSMTIDNPANICMASNESWMVAASKQARRLELMKLDTELAGKQTVETGKKIAGILAVDLRSIAKFFYERDITGFNPRTVVVTDALRSQKIESMAPFDATCLQFLNTGVVKIGLSDEFISEAAFAKSEFYEAVGSSLKFMSETKFWMKIRELFPSVTFNRETVGKARVQQVRFPALSVLRDEFRKAYDDEEWQFDEPNEQDDDAMDAE